LVSWTISGSSTGPRQLFPPPEIAEFPLRLQSACASHLVT
jgi:hypothetical protein